ncbi:Phosphoribosylaminoimidazole-succinocarboxamide synthase [Spatholobus suberectus]|nr:Phosphoribosylaminoimidazole-succinocarboxamide synthase [Spatholobus suberectus]
MGESLVALNPPKTFRSEILPSNRTSPAARRPLTTITFKPHRFRGTAIRASVMPREGQQQQPSLGDALHNSPRKSELADAIRRSALSNCLS